MPPTRWQKRWGGRLRTAGALLLLLGGVGLADPGSMPWTVPLGLFAAGAASFALGRRWR